MFLLNSFSIVWLYFTHSASLQHFLCLSGFPLCSLLSSCGKGCLAHISINQRLEIMHHGSFSRIFLFLPSREKNKRVRMAWGTGSECCFTGICSCFWIAEVTGGEQCAQGLKEIVWLQSVPSHLGRNFLIVTEVLLNRDFASLCGECVCQREAWEVHVGQGQKRQRQENSWPLVRAQTIPRAGA